MPDSGGIVAVTCLAMEARIAGGPGVSVVCNQGPDLIPLLERAIERRPAGIISFGIAGGLAHGLRAGSWVVGCGVKTHREFYPTDFSWMRELLQYLPGAVSGEIFGADAPVASAAEKCRLHENTGALAVDMESHIAGRVAASRSIPFAACRVIIDAADRDLPPAALVRLRPNGTPDIRAICASLARQPGQLVSLARTALDARAATLALYHGRRLLGRGLAYPYADARASIPAAVGLRGDSVAAIAAI